MNEAGIHDNIFFGREYESQSPTTANPYPTIPQANHFIPQQSQNWANLPQNPTIQTHFGMHNQIPMQNNQFQQQQQPQQLAQQFQQTQQQWQQPQQQQQQLQQPNQYIPRGSFDQAQRGPFDPLLQQRASFDVQHQQILHHPQQMALLNVPVPQSSFADQVVVKALVESSQKRFTYKQALESLHGIGGHGGHMWKDYYLDSATRLNKMIDHYSNNHQNGATVRAQEGQVDKHQQNNATASTSTAPNKQPQPSSRSQPERKSVSAAVNASSKKRSTLNSMTAHTAVFSEKLPPPNSEIRIPDPPSRSPTPPTKTVVKGGRNLYTQEDREYFIQFLTWSLKNDPDLTRQELCEMLAEKVPSHTAASWASHWSSRHDIADKILNSYAGIETGESFSSDEDGDGDNHEPPPPRGTRSRPGRPRKEVASISAPVRKVGRPLRNRNRRKDTSSEEDEEDSEKSSEEEAYSDPPPRRRGRPRKRPTPPRPNRIKVKAEPLSDLEGDLKDGDGSDDDSEISLDGFEPGSIDEDERNMGDTGEPYGAADLRVVGRHVADTKDWTNIGQNKRWGPFAEKFPARTPKSWAEYYRRNEKAINTFAAKYKKYKTLQPSTGRGGGSKPQSIVHQKGRPSWATGNAPKRKFNPDSSEGGSKRKLGRVDSEPSLPPPTPASASSPTMQRLQTTGQAHTVSKS